VRRLAGELEASTAVISAPPGYGKTSLLAEWAQRDRRPFAWMALARRHNHPADLLETVLQALDDLEPIDSRLMRQYRRAVHARAAEPLSWLLAEIATIVRSMGGARRPAVLVLDDAHVLTSRGALRVLSAIAAAMPSGSKLVLASRTEPTLRLGRLRAEHELLELGARDLAMTAYEAHQLLRAAGLELDRGAVDRLVTRTEGWPAALYLAALSLRGQADVAAALDRFGGADRGIAEYVRDEILSTLTSAQRALLIDSSILDQLCGALCDAVLERTDAGRVLRTLASRNLTLLPLGGGSGWYRCHSLVRDALRAELELGDADRIARLHARASRWFGERGECDRAIHHAVAAKDAQRVGELLWDHAPEFLMRGRDARVQRWLGGFPDEQIASSPRLALCAAFSQLDLADMPTAERWARAARAAITLAGDRSSALDAGAALIDAALAQRGVERMGVDAARAYELLDEDSPWRAVCSLLQGVADHLAGERAVARENLDEGARLSAAVMPAVECVCTAQLALMDGEDGDWERAEDRAAVAAARLSSVGLTRHPLATLVFAVSACTAGRRGQVDAAKRDLAVCGQLQGTFEGLMSWYEIETRVLMARAAIHLADVARARALLSQASRLLRRAVDVPVFHAWLDDAWAAIDELSASALTGPGSLTIAELRILRFLPTHLSFREIGERLHVSTNTVKSQAHAVYGKLGAASRSEAVAHASALGLIDAPVV
jgi:LuxR family maltose regulon positive regulatory protein